MIFNMSAVLNVVTFELATLETVATVLISWDVTPSKFEDFAIVSKEPAASIFKVKMFWRLTVSPKRSCLCTKAHGVTFRMTASLISSQGCSLVAPYHSSNEIKCCQ